MDKKFNPFENDTEELKHTTNEVIRFDEQMTDIIWPLKQVKCDFECFKFTLFENEEAEYVFVYPHKQLGKEHYCLEVSKGGTSKEVIDVAFEQPREKIEEIVKVYRYELRGFRSLTCEEIIKMKMAVNVFIQNINPVLFQR